MSRKSGSAANETRKNTEYDIKDKVSVFSSKRDFLRFFKLDEEPTNREGNYEIYFSEKGSPQRILDATSGYCGRLFGSVSTSAAPRDFYDSLHQEKFLELSERVSAVFRGAHNVHFSTYFSSSEFEALHIAYRASTAHYQNKMEAIEFDLNENLNMVQIRYSNRKISDLALSGDFEDLLATVGISISNEDTFRTLAHRIRLHNERQYQTSPDFLVLEVEPPESHHPRCPDFSRKDRPLTKIFEFRNTVHYRLGKNEFETFHNQRIARLIALFEEDKVLKVKIIELPHMSGLILDLSEFAMMDAESRRQHFQSIGAFSSRYRLPIAIRFSSSSFFRSGEMSFPDVDILEPSLMVVSNGLSGEVAGTSAILIDKRFATRDFEESIMPLKLPSAAACLACIENLDRLTDPQLKEKLGKKTAYIAMKLKNLVPDQLAPFFKVHLQGFFIELEFLRPIRGFSYELTWLYDTGALAALFASALFHNERVRANWSPRFQRLQLGLPLSVSYEEVDEIAAALERCLTHFASFDFTYFLSHLLPGQPLQSMKIQELQNPTQPVAREKVVFLSHIVDMPNLKHFFSSLEGVDEQILAERIGLISGSLPWQIYADFKVQGIDGSTAQVLLIGLTETSEQIMTMIRNGQRQELIRKLQSGIDYAQKIGATVVGLGQFTSILSKNGMSLNPRGMSLTTGNSFTANLTIAACYRAAEENGIDLDKAKVAFVGAAGNIVSTTAEIMAGRIGACALVYHTSVEKSSKLRNMISGFLQGVLDSDAESSFVRKMKMHMSRFPWQSDQELISFLARPEVADIFQVWTNLDQLHTADIIVTGTNSSKATILPDQIKENAVVVDIGVPQNVHPSVKQLRPDIHLLRGGVAQLPPIEQEMQKLPPLPGMKEGESFACLAETMLIGLSGDRTVYNIGPVTKASVLYTQKLATRFGFTVGSEKKGSTL